MEFLRQLFDQPISFGEIGSIYESESFLITENGIEFRKSVDLH